PIPFHKGVTPTGDITPQDRDSPTIPAATTTTTSAPTVAAPGAMAIAGTAALFTFPQSLATRVPSTVTVPRSVFWGSGVAIRSRPGEATQGRSEDKVLCS